MLLQLIKMDMMVCLNLDKRISLNSHSLETLDNGNTILRVSLTIKKSKSPNPDVISTIDITQSPSYELPKSPMDLLKYLPAITPKNM